MPSSSQAPVASSSRVPFASSSQASASSSRGPFAASSQPSASSSRAPSTQLESEHDGSGTETGASTSKKGSHVWLYFTKHNDTHNICGVVVDGKACGALLKRDIRGSTKAMGEHLRSKHGITAVSAGGGQANIVQSFKKIKTDETVSFFVESLMGSLLATDILAMIALTFSNSTSSPLNPTRHTWYF